MFIDLQHGDCFELIKKLQDESIDLIITSPPYSDIINYGKEVSISKPDDYVDWILPLFNEIFRVLKPSGSFILNINDKVDKGYRSTYIYDLISRNKRETSLKLYDTYIWHKTCGIPNGSTKRFRNTTEFIFHFCKDVKKMKFNMDRALREPVKMDKIKKTKIGATRVDQNGQQQNIFEYRVMPDLVRPENVFRFKSAALAKDNHIKHPAPYHKELPLYFINILTDEGDTVLDPFSGIATTGLASQELNRNYIGFELNDLYNDFAKKRLSGTIDISDKRVINQYDLQGNFIQSHYSFKTIKPIINAPGLTWNGTRFRQYIVGGQGTNKITGFIWKAEKIKSHNQSSNS